MTVLFVDDQEQVLRGIERMLDAAEVEWDAEFAGGGEEALQMLEEDDEIDTVVTDMKMPGMDGAALLSEIQDRFPSIVRIVLSGEADKEGVFRAVKPMHQYLSKPCDAQSLITTVARAAALRDVLISQDLQALLGSIDSLPSVPTVYQELMQLLQSEESSIDSIGEVIAKDPAMTAKVLQISNSAIFGLRKTISDPSRAACLLGIDTVKSLALAVGVFQQFKKSELQGFSPDGLMQHSLEVANLGKLIAQSEGMDKEQVSGIFTASMLHDIGKLVLLATDPDKFAASIQMAGSDGMPLWQAEQKIFGSDHAAVGAHLLSIWGLPQSVIEIVGLHHRPETAKEDSFSMLSAVVAANEIIHAQDQGDTPEYSELFQNYLRDIGCAGRLDDWASLYVADLCEEAV